MERSYAWLATSTFSPLKALRDGDVSLDSRQCLPSNSGKDGSCKTDFESQSLTSANSSKGKAKQVWKHFAPYL
jgi:hypothetical protein